MGTIRRVILVQNHAEELGGVTRFCALLGRGLAARGYEVEVGSVSPPVNREVGAYPSEWPVWSLVDELSPHARVNPITGKPLSDRVIQKQLLKFEHAVQSAAASRFRDLGAETVVIFTQLYARERVGELINAELRYGTFHLVAMYHNSFVGGRGVGDNGRVLRTFAEADKFLSLTAEDAQLYQRFGMNNSGFIQNPMLPLAEIDYPVESRTIVSLGRYDAQKSLDQLIEAWSLLGDESHGWTLDLYGEGPERSSLAQLLKERQISNVRLRGTTSKALDKIAGSAFTVQSSQYEGQPLALMESSAMGIPCVAYNCAPGVAEIILDGETGFLASPNDPYALAYGMRELMQSTQLRQDMGRAARAHVRELFDLEMVLDRWEELFTELEV